MYQHSQILHLSVPRAVLIMSRETPEVDHDLLHSRYILVVRYCFISSPTRLIGVQQGVALVPPAVYLAKSSVTAVNQNYVHWYHRSSFSYPFDL